MTPNSRHVPAPGPTKAAPVPRRAPMGLLPTAPARGLAPAPATRPSRLLALTDRLRYRTELHAYRQARAQRHCEALLHTLGIDDPEPRAVKRAFRHFCAASSALSTPRSREPVPASAAERQACHAALKRQIAGIDAVVPTFEERSHTRRYLQLLRQELCLEWSRVDAVMAYERHREAVREQLRGDLAAKPLQTAALSKNGASGALIVSTQLLQTQSVFAKARAQPPARAAERSASDATDASDASDVSDASSLVGSSESSPLLQAPRARRAPDDPPRIPRIHRDAGDPKTPPAFQVAEPKRQAVRVDEIVKVEDPAQARATLQVYGALDHLASTAAQALPFGFGHHVSDAPTPRQVQRLKTAKASPDRLAPLQKIQSSLEVGGVVVRQEAIRGVSISDAPREQRTAILAKPAIGRAIGATLVVGPLVGLHDHLAPDGCGSNNWTNLMFTEGDGDGVPERLSVIDLAPGERKGLDPRSLAQLRRLVDGLERLARRVGNSGHLPADWRQYLDAAMCDFWNVAFQVDRGLFMSHEFLTPAEQRQHRRLSQSEAECAALQRRIDEHLEDSGSQDGGREAMQRLKESSAQTLLDIRRRLLTLDDLAEQRARERLSATATAAAPHILRGIVDGIGWVLGNAAVLAQARSALPDHAQAVSTAEVVRTFARLSPGARRKLSRLTAVDPPRDGLRPV
ncbi:hypothetical protein [Hydrogenophaga sp. T2]|uniref:hypothetical protein n=1 Tax=Hydrogenophaga sp. T2 TaxID=3132823 RepID=UPI003CE8FA72